MRSDVSDNGGVGNSQSPTLYKTPANKLVKTVRINLIGTLESYKKFTATRTMLNQNKEVNLVRELCDNLTDPGPSPVPHHGSHLEDSSLCSYYWREQNGFSSQRAVVACFDLSGGSLNDCLKGLAFIFSNSKLSQC